MDMKDQYLEFFASLRNVISGDDSLFLSWSRSMGGNYLGLFAYYIASPLSFLTIFFPVEKMTSAIALLTLLKIGLAGAGFAYFADHIRKRTNNISEKFKDVKSGNVYAKYGRILIVVPLAVSYALLSYNMIYSMCLMWLDGVIFLPVILVGIEKIFDGARGGHYIITFAALLYCNYYTGYMVGIFTAVYMVYRIVGRTAEKKQEGNRKKWQKASPKKEAREYQNRVLMEYVGIILRIGVATLLAVGLAASLLVPVMMDLVQGKLSAISYVPDTRTNFVFMNILGKLRNGVYDSITNSGLPPIYCGYYGLFMAGTFFVQRHISIREKAGAFLILVLLACSFYFTKWDMVWHGFQYPTWFPYRYAFVCGFFLLYLALRSICELYGIYVSHIHEFHDTGGRQRVGKQSSTDEQQRGGRQTGINEQQRGGRQTGINEQQRGGRQTGINEQQRGGRQTGINEQQKVDRQTGTDKRQRVDILHGQEKAKYSPRWILAVAIVLIMAVSVDLGINGNVMFTGLDRQFRYSQTTDYEAFLTKTQPLTEWIKEQDQGFYRINQGYEFSKNDAMLLGYHGMTHYSSTFHGAVNALIPKLGMAQAHIWNSGYGSNPLLDSLFGVKYILEDGIVPAEYLLLGGSINGKVEVADENKNWNADGSRQESGRQNTDESRQGSERQNTDESRQGGERQNTDESRQGGERQNTDESRQGSERQNTDQSRDRYDAAVYENINVLPVAYSTVCGNLNPDLSSADPFVNQNILLNTIAGTSHMYFTEYEYTTEQLNPGWSYTFTADSSNPVYLYMKPIKNSWANVTVNEVWVGNYFSTETNCSLFLGNFEPGQQVVVKVVPSGEAAVSTAMIAQLHMDLLAQTMENLSAHGMNIERHENGGLWGNIVVGEQQRIITSIPYDTGWTVRIDGRKVETAKFADTFLAIEAESGEHTISFSYVSPGTGAGMILSACAALGAIIWLWHKSRKVSV